MGKDLFLRWVENREHFSRSWCVIGRIFFLIWVGNIKHFSLKWVKNKDNFSLRWAEIGNFSPAVGRVSHSEDFPLRSVKEE